MAKQKEPSKKAAKRATKSQRGTEPVVASEGQPHFMRRHEHRTPPLQCRTKAQTNYLQLIQEKDVIFGVGPAGTGKSYVSTKFAAQQLEARRIAQIIITRPAVSAEEDLGALPGEIEDKFAPYFGPIREILEGHFGKGAVDCMIKNERILIAPMAYLRGRTFNDCIVLLDEAQNTTVGQMQLFLSRAGENCTMVIDGDPEQVDIKEPSGLIDALELFGENTPAAFGIATFDEPDIVRSATCKEVIVRYRRRATARRLAAEADRAA